MKVGLLLNICFNPHTHEGCDARIVWDSAEPNVSIHTPTKGVTDDDGNIVQLTQVSIHTPTKGVTAYSANS